MKTFDWKNVEDELPEAGEEVLVWIDGHREPAWRNNYALVAYIASNGYWFEERHFSGKPLVGVIKWCQIYIPE